MQFLQMVKDKQVRYDAIFEPLQESIEVLTGYNVEIPDKSRLQLEELPERWPRYQGGLKSFLRRWGGTKRLSVATKQRVGPMQGQEIGKLKNR